MPLHSHAARLGHRLPPEVNWIITDFAAGIDAMSQDEAQRLTKEFLAIEKEKISIKESYVAKMSKVLSARTVARFFQIDQKLDATVDLALAAQIPLIH
jgi:hypothetical protein